MLRSLPCERMVAAISYGCIGRSRREARTASARGFDPLRRVPAMTIHPLPRVRIFVADYMKWPRGMQAVYREFLRDSSGVQAGMITHDRTGPGRDDHARPRRARPG